MTIPLSTDSLNLVSSIYFLKTLLMAVPASEFINNYNYLYKEVIHKQPTSSISDSSSLILINRIALISLVE